ncbi:MAG: hypothetical protein AAF557_09835 [Pseudomonadota bacterium]
MSEFNIGDLVVLKSGSMRMCVEGIEGDTISTVWCNEGVIGRDNFNIALLNKWEFREDSGPRGGDRGGRDRHSGGGKSYGGDREGGGKPFGGSRGGRGKRHDDDGGGRRHDDDRPRKTGWDGKPRDKKFYRKDD